MRWTLVGLIVLTGCFRNLAAPAPGEPGNVYGVRTVGQEQEFQRLTREAANWNPNAAPQSRGVIGAGSGFEQPRGRAYTAPRSTTVVAADAATRREVEVLAARVDRLERMVTTGGPAAAAPQAAPAPAALEIYQVSPDGRTAWVAKGSSKGMKQGMEFQVKRGDAVVGQVQVVRVWPEVSELSVLWSNGAVKRGDSAYEVANAGGGR